MVKLAPESDERIVTPDTDRREGKKKAQRGDWRSSRSAAITPSGREAKPDSPDTESHSNRTDPPETEMTRTLPRVSSATTGSHGCKERRDDEVEDRTERQERGADPQRKRYDTVPIASAPAAQMRTPGTEKREKSVKKTPQATSIVMQLAQRLATTPLSADPLLPFLPAFRCPRGLRGRSEPMTNPPDRPAAVVQKKGLPRSTDYSL